MRFLINILMKNFGSIIHPKLMNSRNTKPLLDRSIKRGHYHRRTSSGPYQSRQATEHRDIKLSPR